MGINLTAANRAIFFDTDYNPYTERQAEDRCHRMGQTKTVHITRLLSAGSVEERIYEQAQKKLRLGLSVTEKFDLGLARELLALAEAESQQDDDAGAASTGI